jgi:hypothetical protein
MPKAPKKFYKKAAKEVVVVTLPVRERKKMEFPSIPLTIPEGLTRFPSIDLKSLSITTFLTHKVFLFNFTIGFLIMAIGLVGYDLRNNMRKVDALRIEKQTIEKQIVHWQGIVAKYKDFRDGYYQLAVLVYRLGDKQMASQYADKALVIDPEFTLAQRFKENIK